MKPQQCGKKRSRAMLSSTNPSTVVVSPKKIVKIKSSYDRGDMSSSCSSEEGDRATAPLNQPISPQAYLETVTKRAITPSLSADPDFFLKYSEEQLNAYDHEVTAAVRNGDLGRLRELHSNGHILQCSNRFGESLIHIACRRGQLDIVKFLVNEAGVTPNVRDDYGRTPLHDACWTAAPNTDLFDFIVKKSPDLLFFSDQRGHSPLQYVRREHWPLWVSYLKKQQLEDF